MEDVRPPLAGQDAVTHGRSGGDPFTVGLLTLASSIRSYETGGWVIDYAAREALYGGVVLPLTKTEFLILAILARNDGVTLSHEEITQGVWGQWYSDYHHIHVHISRLRQKIRNQGADPETISNIHGVGYRFRGPR